jgi:hypothetical protein
MNRDPPPTTVVPTDPLPLTSPPDSLTPGQLAFARLLGRLLTDRWDREQSPPSRPASAPAC